MAGSEEGADLVFERRECHLAVQWGHALVCLDDQGHDVFPVWSIRVWLGFAIYYMSCLRLNDLSREFQITVDTHGDVFQERKNASETLKKIVLCVERQPICSVE